MKNGKLLVQVLALVVTGALMATAIVFAFGSIQIKNSNTYEAIFTDVSGLDTTSDVRAAGVRIGSIESTELQPDNTIKVTMSVENGVPLTTGTRATVRYKNLLGDRYLELTPGGGALLPNDGVLPVSQTAPALDLDALYNGFAPLFQGLAPDQINKLSGSLIQVLQGQAGSVDSLLSDVGSLTNTLADRDQLIGQLITNLNTVLGAANQKAPELSDGIVQLQTLVTRYAQERGPLGQSIQNLNGLAASVANLLVQVRPELAGNINQIGRVSQVIDSDSADLNQTLKQLPGYYQLLGRLGAYSEAFQFYLCGAEVRINLPGAPPVSTGMIQTPQENNRCRY